MQSADDSPDVGPNLGPEGFFSEFKQSLRECWIQRSDHIGINIGCRLCAELIDAALLDTKQRRFFALPDQDWAKPCFFLHLWYLCAPENCRNS